MNFKKRQSGSQVPQVNLVPMMDVLMTVLTFFIIISMTLTGQSVNVLLPQARGAAEGEAIAEQKLVIGLNAQQEIILNNQTIPSTQLLDAVQQFLQANPDGVVVLKADRTLNYREVSGLLKSLRDIGGSKVVLGIDLES
jgi:biopolymer transport protein ExbD